MGHGIDTPVMRQYREVKQRYEDCIVFFRMGDFYEMFFEDATYAANVLDLTLTSRDRQKENAPPMCGVPYHAAKQYIAKLIAQGKKVAICEQVEDARMTKGIVRRAVTQVITPGVLLDEEQLSAKTGHYLAAISSPAKSGEVGFAYLDVSTGEFATTCIPKKDVEDELGRIQPAELLLISAAEGSESKSLFQTSRQKSIPMGQEKAHSLEENKALLRKLVLVDDKMPEAALAAAAACIRYAQATQLEGTLPVQKLQWYQSGTELILDELARKHLELFQTQANRQTHGSLWGMLDQTQTAPGGRLLWKWLGAPSRNLGTIARRHDAVEWLVNHHSLREQVRTLLKQIYDIERLTGRISLEIATPRDLARLGRSLLVVPALREVLMQPQDAGLIAEDMPMLLQVGEDLCGDVAELLVGSLQEDPPNNIREGGIFRRGYHQELDQVIELAQGGKQHMLDMEERERVRTGIGSLKINYNRVFGYYIEITRTHFNKIPADYIRKQTLAQAERFVTPELSEYEARVLGAEEKRLQLEETLFVALRKSLLAELPRLFALASQLAHLDAVGSLAEVAHRGGYVRPEMDEGLGMFIEEGRHPVIEQLLPAGKFVSNDVRLDPDTQQIYLLTGPNMAGKSTVMRQVALICILAQMGSFVPAKKAKLGVLDRIFTRVGAGDNLSAGDSTFMVEMRETAHILQYATRRSLVVLDEIGRGTSTYDGMSIAWAVAEYLHDYIGCKTLFATHYHELCALTESHPRVCNMSVAVKLWQGKIVFLHKLVTGAANRSYGIEVAQLAGLPKEVLTPAKEMLRKLEAGEHGVLMRPGRDTSQLALFQPATPPSSATQEIVDALETLDCNQMTPKDALLLLMKWSGELAAARSK